MIHHFGYIVPGQRGQYEPHIAHWKKVEGALRGTCTPPTRAHIEPAETSAGMWEILSKCANSANTEKGRQALPSKFRTIKAQSGESLSDYFGRLTEALDPLKGTDHEIVDWVFRDQLLHNVPDSYAVIKKIMEHIVPYPPTHNAMETLKGKEIDLDSSAQPTAAARYKVCFNIEDVRWKSN